MPPLYQMIFQLFGVFLTCSPLQKPSMPDHHHLKNSKPPAPAPQSTASSTDLLNRVVDDLNIARRNMQIYPSDHHSVQHSLSRAWNTLKAAMAQWHPLTLAVTTETLSINGQELDPRGINLPELARVFKQAGIVAVDFLTGLTQEELGRLIRLSVRDSQARRFGNGVSEEAIDNDFKHIKIYRVDYSQLEVTDESRIALTGQPDHSYVWDHFVNNVMTHARVGDAAAGGPVSDPVVLAGMINRKMVDIEAVVETYTRSLKTRSIFGNTGRKASPAAGNGDMGGFSDMLQELHPVLREQLLSATFDHCAAHTDSEKAADVLDGLGTEIIIQMLRHAKADGKKISPSLVSLIQKIGHLPQTGGQLPHATADQKSLSSTRVQSLLRSEDYETFVDRDYDKLLKGIAGQPSRAEPVKALADTLASGLDNVVIDCHIGLALTRLMAISGDTQGYRDWARQLTLTLDDLVDDGAFDCLADIFTFLLEEDGFQTEPEKRKVVGLVLNRFSDPQFLANVIDRAEAGPGAIGTAGATLLKHIGNAALIEVLEAMHPKDSPDQVRTKMVLLAPFGRRAAEEALQRLNDPRPAYLCLMIQVVRQWGDADMVEGLHILIKHENCDVRLEALGALLKHRNGWGMGYLRKLVGKAWSHETLKALELAAHYKVREAVPMLVSWLEQWGGHATEPEKYQGVLAALEGIGDPEALPILEKLARRRWSLSKNKLRFKQRCLFDSLGGYPYSDVAELIHFGLKHKDQEIRERCRELLKRFHRHSSSSATPVASEEAT